MQKISIAALILVLISSNSSYAGVDLTENSITKESISAGKKTDTEKLLAKNWNLTDEEQKTYKEIMSSPRAYFTPNIDKNPLLALALEAKTPAERAKYADRWVKLQYENNLKVLAWSLETQEAWTRNYPGVPRFVYKDSSAKNLAVSNQMKVFSNTPSLSDLMPPRAQLYIKSEDCSKCVNLFNKLYSMTKGGKYSGIDVHFVGGDTKSIIDWAVKNKLDPAEVNDSQLVTLNISEKVFENLPLLE